MSQKVIAAQMMRDLEKQYGRAFLENSLHQARFDYTALSRVARGLDPEIPRELLVTSTNGKHSMKLDKKAHARALELHEKMLREDTAYREAWDRLVAELFTGLADAPPIPSQERNP